VKLNPPRPIRLDDDLSGFDCGNPILNDWLRERAAKSEAARDARTYVVTNQDGNVVGYYCLSAFSVARARAGGGWLARNFRGPQAPGAAGGLGWNAPDPVPAVLLGRLAVDVTCQGSGLGASLLADAIDNAVRVAELIGARALIVDAIDDAARRFYEHHEFIGFKHSPGRLAHRI
jgi:predicted N-acetyltransferase YhbS